MAEILNIDHETGKATFTGPHFQETMDKFKAVVAYLDEEHDLFLLCEHPVTKEWGYWSVVELMQPESSLPKMSVVK